MAKTVTLRIDDSIYDIFHAFADSENRSLANLIETAAKKHLEECLFVDETEMRGILEDKHLLGRLKKGALAAKKRQGQFVE
ncbi:MAG: CopG family transcriptional regulator [Deltaproteobacteria bacterium]|nr:CopG family transcriptional regulator [Deltaproteobacteria bacterium]